MRSWRCCTFFSTFFGTIFFDVLQSVCLKKKYNLHHKAKRETHLPTHMLRWIGTFESESPECIAAGGGDLLYYWKPKYHDARYIDHTPEKTFLHLHHLHIPFTPNNAECTGVCLHVSKSVTLVLEANHDTHMLTCFRARTMPIRSQPACHPIHLDPYPLWQWQAFPKHADPRVQRHLVDFCISKDGQSVFVVTFDETKKNNPVRVRKINALTGQVHKLLQRRSICQKACDIAPTMLIHPMTGDVWLSYHYAQCLDCMEITDVKTWRIKRTVHVRHYGIPVFSHFGLALLLYHHAYPEIYLIDAATGKDVGMVVVPDDPAIEHVVMTHPQRALVFCDDDRVFEISFE